MTPRGAIHLWVPPRYDAVTAGLLVYVHGLYINVDNAWTAHRLAEQFAASKKNAVFVACEAPVEGLDQPLWDSLPELVDTSLEFLRTTKTFLPQVPDVIVVGHSGAYRSIVLWLDDPTLRHVVLVDGLYGNEDEYSAWIDGSVRGDDGAWSRQLTLVAESTYRWVEPFVSQYDDVVFRPAIPDTLGAFNGAERRARILYMPSQYEHMALVTEGRALPVLLAQTRLADLPRPRAGRRGR
jgi:hypothetical protein